jgi:hypothetical protein
MKVSITCNLTPYLAIVCVILLGYSIYTGYAVYTWAWDTKCQNSHTIFQNTCLAILNLLTDLIFILYLVMLPSNNPTNRQITICSILYTIAFSSATGNTWVFYDSGFYQIISSREYHTTCNHEYVMAAYTGVILAMAPIYLSIIGFVIYILAELIKVISIPTTSVRQARRHAVTQTNPEFVNPKYDVDVDIDLSWHGEPDSVDGDSREYLLNGQFGSK